MKSETTFDPNHFQPSEVASMALTDPRLKMTNRVRKALRRQCVKHYVSTRVPKKASDRIVEQLAAKSRARLIRFVKKSARRAATAMYVSKKTEGPFSAAAGQEQTRQLALMRAGLRMIQHRINPTPSNEV